MRTIGWITLACAALTTTGAPAQPGRGAEEKAEDEARRAAEKRARDERRDAGAPAEDETNRRVADVRKKFESQAEARRWAARAKAKGRWGEKLAEQPVRAELAIHARRVARLNVLEDMAKARGKGELLPRIAKLRAKEEARHERRMAKLTSGDGGAK